MPNSAFSARPLHPGQLKVIFFDVNETLLDLSKVKKAVISAFSDKSAFRQWFGLLLQYSLVDTVTERYHPFSVIANAALDMTAYKLQTKPLKAVKKEEIITLMAQLPAHPDVEQCLDLLARAGYRLVAFTNSTQRVLDQQLRHAGIIGYFEQGISVDAVQRYKPHKAAYHEAARRVGVMPDQAALVAAHGWDIVGAQAAGLATGFLARPGQEWYPLALPPTFHGKKLPDIARQILSR